MCLAIFKPAGKQVSETFLKNGFTNHSDGAGFCWSDGNNLFVEKGFFNFERFLERYNMVKDNPCLIHFRKATHGKVDEDNCHPFLFNGGKLALIHNGVLPIQCTIEGLSDTAHFVLQVLEPMIKTHGVPINDGSLNYLIITSIGSDKMAVMNSSGETFLFNGDEGVWDDGVWFSNTSYKWNTSVVSTISNSQIWANRYNSGTIRTYVQTNDEPTEKELENYIEFWKKIDKTNTTVESKTESADISTAVETPEVSDESAEETEKCGTMCEYGLWDSEVELAIETIQKTKGSSRANAMLEYFLNL